MAAVARVLIVAGGCRGRRLSEELIGSGHAVRATTRGEAGRAAIEASGAECWIGTPDRLATLRGALENVTIACWMLASATAELEQLQALHGSRLEFFLTQAIDTTVRGFVYESVAPTAAPDERERALAGGEQIARGLSERNAIPLQVIHADTRDVEAWLAAARAAIDALLAGR
jgi:uncharacterized protein YbjT (DUF2867 family)